MFRQRRQRRVFEEAALAEVERVRPHVTAELDATKRDIAEARKGLGEVPGTAARCPACGERMTLGPVKDGRRWWTLWTCSGCGRTYRPSEFEDAARLGGRR